MNGALKELTLLTTYSKEMRGVLSVGDLQCLFGQNNSVQLYRRIKMLEESGVLARFSRGFYVTPGFDRETLATRINEMSYISLGTILAKELMTGSQPSATVYAVKTGKNREYHGAGMTLLYAGISPRLFFGFKTENSIRYATPEKALLDTLYFHQRGHSFSFNIYEDIDVSRLNIDTLYKMLEQYANPRFRTFVTGYINGRD